MKISPFTSQFSDDALPVITGLPKSKAYLSSAAEAIPREEREQESIANFLGEAVYSYYFMKRVYPALKALQEHNTGPTSYAMQHLSKQLVKQAVVGIASCVDSIENTKSFFATIKRMRTELETEEEDSHLEKESLDELLKLVQFMMDPDRQDRDDSLRYVKHLRNKWAAHASWDRDFDDWADADTTVSFPLMEDALVQVVNAAQALGQLKEASDTLQESEDAWRTTENPDGTTTIKMALSLSGIGNLASVFRFNAQRDAVAFVAELNL